MISPKTSDCAPLMARSWFSRGAWRIAIFAVVVAAVAKGGQRHILDDYEVRGSAPAPRFFSYSRLLDLHDFTRSFGRGEIGFCGVVFRKREDSKFVLPIRCFVSDRAGHKTEITCPSGRYPFDREHAGKRIFTNQPSGTEVTYALLAPWRLRAEDLLTGVWISGMIEEYNDLVRQMGITGLRKGNMNNFILRSKIYRGAIADEWVIVPAKAASYEQLAIDGSVKRDGDAIRIPANSVRRALGQGIVFDQVRWMFPWRAGTPLPPITPEGPLIRIVFWHPTLSSDPENGFWLPVLR